MHWFEFRAGFETFIYPIDRQIKHHNSFHLDQNPCILKAKTTDIKTGMSEKRVAITATDAEMKTHRMSDQPYQTEMIAGMGLQVKVDESSQVHVRPR